MTTIVAGKYQLLEPISHGSFGSVFKAINIRTNDIVALKLAKSTNINLKNEAKIYQYLQRLEGFPKLKMYGTFRDHSYLALNLLGPSLDSLDSRQFSQSMLLNFAVQIFKRIQTLHEHSLLHRDIKPSNFLLSTDLITVHLIDFGFAKRYNFDGKHIDETCTNSLIGSPNFVSLNVHNHFEPSRRDDMESAIYVLISLFSNGLLPWSNCQTLEQISRCKRTFTATAATTKVPLFIEPMLSHVRELRFKDGPDYDYLISLITT